MCQRESAVFSPRRGFTLIELLVVIGIIAILAALGMMLVWIQWSKSRNFWF